MELKLSSRDTLIAALIGIIVVAGLVVAFLIMPRFKEIGRLEAELAQADQQIAEAQAVLNRRQDAKAAAAKTQAELLALANSMPDAPEMPTLIIELQDIANEAGLVFVSVKPTDPEQDPGGFTAIKMDMVVTGQWPDVIEYLRRLAKLDRQVRIVKTKVVKLNPTNDADTTLKAEISLEAYTLAAPSAGATAVPVPGTAAAAPAQ